MSIYHSTAHNRAAGSRSYWAGGRTSAHCDDRRHRRSISTDSSDPTGCSQIDRACPQGVALTMSNITILGAGSTVFARQLMTDILQSGGLAPRCFSLVDIDASRLDLAQQ